MPRHLAPLHERLFPAFGLKRSDLKLRDLKLRDLKPGRLLINYINIDDYNSDQ